MKSERGRQATLLAVSLNNVVMKCSAATAKDRPLFPRLLQTPVYSDLSLFTIAMCKGRQNTCHKFSALEFSIIDTKGVG
jgi:hypothetical protein